MLLKGQFRRTSELPMAIIWSPLVHFCPDRIEIESSASRNSRKALSFQLVVKLLRCGINGNELYGKYYFSLE